MRETESVNPEAVPAPADFCGTWRIIAGNPVGQGFEPERYDVRIAPAENPPEEGHYDLFSIEWEQGRGRGPSKETFLQRLRYREDTHTLEDRAVHPGPERCIGFWNRNLRSGNGLKSIYALRVGEIQAVPQADLPLFEQGGAGSWGAEGG